ncbi:hypothetical protein [Pseudoroseomonas cervicalis]|uniref:hypothetical protein n=1 Tax=Teichococcus cervicalis TaxID=204525 RepID=UPI002789F27F|nr:hypothetical protein [Pseudoroseomonas cervicalis]MDQ1078011.1 hypothetical protein [Pseudoroseomonas cervicalis]
MTAVGPRIYLAEISAYRPGLSAYTGQFGIGSRPHGALGPAAQQLEDMQTVRASDAGYVSEVVAGDVTRYPPVLVGDWVVDRHIELDPTSTASPLTVGSISLANEDGRFDQVAAEYSPDSRTVRVLTGRRSYDADRGSLVDPPLSGLSQIFGGLAETWRLSEGQLVVPLRDAAAWLDRPYLQSVYAGTGGLAGSADMAGQTIPRARGGQFANPIRAVKPVLVDAVNRIYQYNDGPGQVVQVYENAAAVFTSAGDTTNLYSGSTPNGQFRTDNSKGLFQLGSTAIGLDAITADVVGNFPVAGAASQITNIARLMLTEDMAIPASLIDTSSFSAATALTRRAGWYWPSGDQSTAGEAVSQILRGAGAKLVPGRDGRLRILLMAGVASTATPVRSLGTAQIVDLRPNWLSAPLDPPAYRWRVGYRRNHTVQTSGLNAGLTDTQRREAGQEWRLGVWSSADVLAAYTRPSNPDVVSTGLLIESEAQAAAQDIGALWGMRRTLYDVDIPEEIAMTMDLGDVVRLTWPAADLRNGRLGRVVGEQIRTSTSIITLQVLV